MMHVLRAWPVRAWAIAAAALLATLFISGIPTGVIPSSWYHRMTPVLWWNYPIWIISAFLAALIAGSYFTGRTVTSKDKVSRGIFGGLSSVLAIGCPLCNKIAVALLGVTGALSYVAPIQPVLGVAGIALLAWTLWLRLRGQLVCRVPSLRPGTTA